MQTIKLQNNKIKYNGENENILIENNTLTIKEKTNENQPFIIKVDDIKNNEFVINIKDNSSLKFIIELSDLKSKKNEYNFNINIGKNTNVEYLILSELSSEEAILNQNFNVDKDSTLKLLSGYINSNIKSNNLIKLVGENSTAQVNGIIISGENNNQQVDFNIEHHAANSFGDMMNVGVASSNGKVVLNGIAKIFKGMKKVNAFQTLKGIITSDDAFMEVNPILLIDEHDIKAGHGATIGKIEEEPLFYLMSRGIPRKEAERIIIMGFLEPVISKIEDEDIKNKFLDMVNSRI